MHCAQCCRSLEWSIKNKADRRGTRRLSYLDIPGNGAGRATRSICYHHRPTIPRCYSCRRARGSNGSRGLCLTSAPASRFASAFATLVIAATWRFQSSNRCPPGRPHHSIRPCTSSPDQSALIPTTRSAASPCTVLCSIGRATLSRPRHAPVRHIRAQIDRAMNVQALPAAALRHQPRCLSAPSNPSAARHARDAPYRRTTPLHHRQCGSPINVGPDKTFGSQCQRKSDWTGSRRRWRIPAAAAADPSRASRSGCAAIRRPRSHVGPWQR
jgi:hypothetical protein